MKRMFWITLTVIVILSSTACSRRLEGAADQPAGKVPNLATAQTAGSQGVGQAADEADRSLVKYDQALQSVNTLEDLSAQIAPTSDQASGAYDELSQSLDELEKGLQSMPALKTP